MKRILPFLLLLGSFVVAQERDGIGDFWQIQAGVAKAVAIDPSLDGRMGHFLELRWDFPFGGRQDCQARAGLSSIDGRDAPLEYVPASIQRSKVSTLYTGINYRVRFLRGDWTPFFVVGLFRGSIDYTRNVRGPAASESANLQSTENGLNLGLGFRLGKRFELEARVQAFGNDAFNASAFMFGLAYRL